MDSDLVLEGGGVKGIGLVGAISVLQYRGYVFHRIAGASAGAIVGSLVAAGMDSGALEALMRSIDYTRFEDKSLLDDIGAAGEVLSVLLHKGIYRGDYLHSWLSHELAKLGVRTFGDLKLPPDQSSDLPKEGRYKLVVIVSDVTRGKLVHFPWDYADYGLVPDEQPVADAVRASMSIPFFYRPVRLHDPKLGIDCYLVDGGALSNFPIDVFDRRDHQAPRWPTFGIKLSAKPNANQVAHTIESTLDLAKALVGTMSNAHDQMHLDDPCTQRRTIFIDTMQVKATDFHLDTATQQKLFENGLDAATRFLDGGPGQSAWDFASYVTKCRT